MYIGLDSTLSRTLATDGTVVYMRPLGKSTRIFHKCASLGRVLFDILDTVESLREYTLRRGACSLQKWIPKRSSLGNDRRAGEATLSTSPQTRRMHIRLPSGNVISALQERKADNWMETKSCWRNMLGVGPRAREGTRAAQMIAEQAQLQMTFGSRVLDEKPVSRS